MSHVNDDKLAALRAKLLVTGGTIDDLEIVYLQTAGATSDQVNDAWNEVFIANSGGAAKADRHWHSNAVAFLTFQMVTVKTNLSDLWAEFWSLGVLP